MIDNLRWQDGVDVATVATAVLFALAAHAVIFRLLSRFRFGVEGSVVRHARTPLRLMMPIIAILLVLPLVDLSPSTEQFVSRSLGLIVIGCFGWLAIALISVAEDVIAERYPIAAADNLNARALRTRVSVLRSASAVIIIIITASIILMSFPSVRQLGVSLLASAGLIALVVGMAARPAFENLIAGLQIALTQPIKLDDVVVVEGEWGQVEEITTTYVVVRIWDSRRLILPLSYFITNPVENWTRRTADIVGTVMVYTDYTVPVDEVREELHAILRESSKWDRRSWGLQVTSTSESSVELRAVVSAKNSSDLWDLRCEVREKLVSLVQRRWPASLPKTRAEFEWPSGMTNGAAASK